MRLLNGELDSATLVEMSSEEMAKDDVKCYREARAKKFEASIVKDCEEEGRTYKKTVRGMEEIVRE